METPLTEDALLGGRVRLFQPRRGYRVAVDAVLLAATIDAGPQGHILDLGAGVGAVGLCIARRVAGCQILGVELQAELALLAGRNAVLNGFGDRIRTIVHDLAAPLPAEISGFDHVVSNPPYLAAAVADPPPDASKALATVESSAPLARWLAVATGAAKPAGTLTIIHRNDRVAEIAEHLERLGWADLTVRPLAPARRVLVRARRAHKPVRQERPPLVLHRADGSYTDQAEAILRHAEPLAF